MDIKIAFLQASPEELVDLGSAERMPRYLGFEGNKAGCLRLEEKELIFFNGLVEGNLLAFLGGERLFPRYLPLSDRKRWANLLFLEGLAYRLKNVDRENKIKRLVDEAKRIKEIYDDKAVMLLLAW